ncbi:MAG: hypothetical protein AAGA34_12260 [Pseudomonadota bacterium]
MAFTALALSLWFVTSEMAHLGDMVGGITPLDAQYGYGREQIVEFAEAPGAEGPREYVAFQLGAEALAPPAFLGFLIAVYRGTVWSQKAQGALTALALPISHRSCSRTRGCQVSCTPRCSSCAATSQRAACWAPLWSATLGLQSRKGSNAAGAGLYRRMRS